MEGGPRRIRRRVGRERVVVWEGVVDIFFCLSPILSFVFKGVDLE